MAVLALAVVVVIMTNHQEFTIIQSVFTAAVLIQAEMTWALWALTAALTIFVVIS